MNRGRSVLVGVVVALLHAGGSIMTVFCNDTTLGLEAASRMPMTPVWAVLGFPVFTILSSLGVKLWFLPMVLSGLANSALWGALAAMLATRLRNRPRATA